eukprot:TRINITY_DN8347_c0_g1_i2.p1 TRINITY_DN8347_c0_g1~~TRINITY_DN8347_c0_g1_i2.p1  ORF type:complete len:111 (+),score=23.40 TRINITY_DN8347_c0_g1_i2:96-428(+)
MKCAMLRLKQLDLEKIRKEILKAQLSWHSLKVQTSNRPSQSADYASQIETRIQSWKDAAVEIDASIDEIVNKQQALSNDAEERQEFLKQEQARVMTLVQVFMAKIGVRLP